MGVPGHSEPSKNTNNVVKGRVTYLDIEYLVCIKFIAYFLAWAENDMQISNAKWFIYCHIDRHLKTITIASSDNTIFA